MDQALCQPQEDFPSFNLTGTLKGRYNLPFLVFWMGKLVFGEFKYFAKGDTERGI